MHLPVRVCGQKYNICPDTLIISPGKIFPAIGLLPPDYRFEQFDI